jgi:iron(III) transport system substrate-binding protein
MKKLLVVAAAVFLSIISGIAFAQKSGTQEMPTYQGDTDKTVARRAQWIEGAKKEGGMLSWWGILAPSEGNRIIAEFNKVYPFIKIDYWRGRGEEIAAKLEAEFAGGRLSVDFCYGGAPENNPRWAKMGMLERYTDIIPGIDKLDKRRYGVRGDWVIPGLAPKTPQYNTGLVSPAEAPKSFDDMLNPKWRGQMGVEVESENWATLALSEGGWGLEKTQNYLMKLKELNPRFIQGGSAAHSLLVAGEFKIMAMGNLRHVIVSQEKKAPVDWIRVNPVLVTGPAYILMKKASHPNAARLFLEWQFSHQGLPVWANVSQHYVPGIVDQMSKYLEGMHLIIRTEEVVLKGIEMGVIKKFNKLLYGIED